MGISLVSISFGPGTSPAPEPDGRRFRVKHALRSLKAGETNWTSIDHAIEAAAAVLKAADEKRQAAIAAVMNGS
jgi:hypothetical protein